MGKAIRFVQFFMVFFINVVYFEFEKIFFVVTLCQQFELGNLKISWGKMARNTRATSSPLEDSQKSTQDYVNITQNSQNELCVFPSNLYVSDQIGEDEFNPQCRIQVGKIGFFLTKTEDFIAAKLLNTQATNLNYIIWDSTPRRGSLQFGLIIVLKENSQNYTAQSQEI